MGCVICPLAFIAIELRVSRFILAFSVHDNMKMIVCGNCKNIADAVDGVKTGVLL